MSTQIIIRMTYTMLNYLGVLILLSCQMSTVFAQHKAPQLHEYKFSFEIEQALATQELNRYQAAQHYSYIGAYQRSLETADLPPTHGLSSMTAADSLAFLAYRPVDVFVYLDTVLAKQDVVIINEDHQKPQHRIFTMRLLETLYEDGFRHLGLETLTPHYEDRTKYLMDTAMNERGYPQNMHRCGFFTREPQMGHLVRAALRLGFKVFAYEILHGVDTLERDLQQAFNIQRYMKAHPDEKIVVHCGHGHVIESGIQKGNRKGAQWMAYHLEALTEVNPLTIAQDDLTERYVMPSSPYFDMVEADEISVLLDESGRPFHGVDSIQHVDMQVYHPPTKFIRRRPHWLKDIPGRQFVDVDETQVESAAYPVRVEAYIASETYGVPADVIELMDELDDTPLILAPETYHIRITNRQGQRRSYMQVVE